MSELLIHAAFDAILKSSSDMVFVKDANLVYQAVSMPFVRMVGKTSREEIVGHTDLEIFTDKALAKRYIADDHKLLDAGEDMVDYMEPITEDNGKARYGSTSKYILRNEQGEKIGILGITIDMTRDYVARQRYQQELKYLFELPVDTYAVSYIDIDSWRVMNQRRREINGATVRECNTIEELICNAQNDITDSHCEAAAFYREFSASNLWNIYASGRSNIIFKYERIMTDGSIRWVRDEIRFLSDVDNGHLCAVLIKRDIDAIKQEEKQLTIAARMDKMTMVLNRETTMDYIRQILEQDSDQLHALFMLDVDNFKKLNDTLGHQVGDEFLIALAKELKNNFRESDVIGRIGGDEFFILMQNISDIRQTERKAKQVMAAIRKVCDVYPVVDLSGSIGISLYPGNGRTLDELYKKADQALYVAKRNGKNRYVFYRE